MFVNSDARVPVKLFDVHACSTATFKFQLPDQTTITERMRCLDFPFPGKCYFYFFNKGDQGSSPTPGTMYTNKLGVNFWGAGSKNYTWINKYNAVGIGGLAGKKSPCPNIFDGINSAGLSGGGNTLLEDNNQNPETTNLQALAVSNYTQYILTTCATIEDVVEATENHCIYESTMDDISVDGNPMAFPKLHFLFATQNDSVVVEFVDGNAKTYTESDPVSPSIGVMTNDPVYPSMLDQFKATTANASPVVPATMEINGQVLNTNMTSSGLNVIPWGYSSVNRFNMLGTLKRFMDDQVPNVAAADQMIWKLVNPIWTPRGLETVQMGSKFVGGQTYWAVTYNLKTCDISWKTALNETIQKIAFDSISFAPGAQLEPTPLFTEEEDEYYTDKAKRMMEVYKEHHSAVPTTTA